MQKHSKTVAKNLLPSIPRYFSLSKSAHSEQNFKNSTGKVTLQHVLKEAQDVSKRFQYPFEIPIPATLQDVYFIHFFLFLNTHPFSNLIQFYIV